MSSNKTPPFVNWKQRDDTETKFFEDWTVAFFSFIFWRKFERTKRGLLLPFTTPHRCHWKRTLSSLSFFLAFLFSSQLTNEYTNLSQHNEYATNLCHYETGNDASMMWTMLKLKEERHWLRWRCRPPHLRASKEVFNGNKSATSKVVYLGKHRVFIPLKPIDCHVRRERKWEKRRKKPAMGVVAP